MNVIILNDFCHIQGGASKVAIDEAVGLKEVGINVTFIGATGPVGEELKAANVKTICLDQPELINVGKSPAVMLQGLWNKSAYKKMLEVLDVLNPADTIIHLHGYTKSLSTSPIAAAKKKGFKVICTLHDFFAACPNGAQFDYQDNKPCERKCLSMSCIAAHCDKRRYHHKIYRVARSFSQKILGHFPSYVCHYIGLSEKSVSLLKPYLPDDSKVFMLENIIEVEKQEPADITQSDHVVYVGRLDKEKGIENLLTATKDAGLPLVLVGDGPLRELAEAYGHVKVTGWVSPQDVIDHIRKARCLVFPSLWYETYGLVVSEAAAQGVSAIISDVSAPSERVTDTHDGWIFRAGDVADLTQKIEIIKNNDTLKAAGQNAYDRFWQSPPSQKNHITGLIDIYKKILENV